MGTAAVPFNAAHQRQIVDAFRSARALTGSSARKLRDLGLQDSGPLRRMVASAIIRKAGPERFFLDESVWTNRRPLRARTILRVGLVLGIVIAVLAVVQLWQ